MVDRAFLASLVPAFGAAMSLGLVAGCGAGTGRAPRDGSPGDASVEGVAPHDAAQSSEGGVAADASQDSPSPDAAADAGAPTGVAGWSVRKRFRSTAGADLVLEEVPFSYTVTLGGASRLRLLADARGPERQWTPPDGAYIAGACWHPSGEVSAVLLDADRTVSLARLRADLTTLSVAAVHDPAIARDPNANDAGAQDLLANGFAPDAAQIAGSGEDVVAVVDTSWNSIVAYRASYSDASGAWSTPSRTLLEPPAPLTPFLPTSGSFDTFGAIVAWFRSPLDVDEQGNAYVAVWADPSRIAAHVAAFHDALAPVLPDPSEPPVADGDILLTKMDAQGARLWSRVVGTPHEDEPYAVRARAGVVAVVGRTRRLPGFDNTTWDAFASVMSATGEPIITRAIAFDASAIFLAVDLPPGGGLIAAGSDGWQQNPSGLSVFTYGVKLLVGLGAFDATPVRWTLAPGPRNNEIRTVLADDTEVWFGGDEDGPIMHTGDGDLTQIHATGVLGALAR
jgi:hypothetical protein